MNLTKWLLDNTFPAECAEVDDGEGTFVFIPGAFETPRKLSKEKLAELNAMLKAEPKEHFDSDENDELPF